MKDLTFISGNAHKVAQVTKWIGMPLAHQKLDLDEIQSLDLHQVAEHKVRQAYDLVQKPVLIEDASLTFLAMGKLPGTFIKWFYEEIGVLGLAKLAASLEHQQAVGRVCYAIYDGTALHFFDGEMRGHILSEPEGQGGFGFDPIFVSEGFEVSRARLSEDDYMRTSYRTDGLNKLREFLHAQD